MAEINPSEQEEKFGQLIWDYMKLNQKLKRADLILTLGSIDTLPARRAAELYKLYFAPNLLFTGGAGGRNYDELPNARGATTEAQMLAKEAVAYGVPAEAILLEEKAKNSRENVIFSKEILEKKGIEARTIIVSHMPSSERRDYATLRKQWLDPEFILTSPKVSFRHYHIEGYQGLKSRTGLIEDMLGDFQRLFVFPREEFGYMMSQEELGLDLPSDSVKEAYTKLIGKGFGRDQLVKNKKTGNPYEIFCAEN